MSETKAIRVTPDLHERIAVQRIKGDYRSMSAVIEDNITLPGDQE